MTDRILKIGLIGCAGLGKSHAAAQLSESLGLPFLKSKDITRPVLKSYGWSPDGSDVESFLGRCTIESEIVRRRLEEEALLSGGFVTDRTTLECFCYAFQALHTYTPESLALLESACRANMSRYTHLFYIPASAGWLEDNGLRTTSPLFQRKIDLMIRGVMQDWGVPVEAIPYESCNGKTAEYVLSRL